MVWDKIIYSSNDGWAAGEKETVIVEIKNVSEKVLIIKHTMKMDNLHLQLSVRLKAGRCMTSTQLELEPPLYQKKSTVNFCDISFIKRRTQWEKLKGY